MQQTYESIIDLLNHEGPGLQDYVTPDQLDQLIDGTLAPAEIADQYLDDLAATTRVAVATDTDETRRDLLLWIRWEIDGAVQQRTDDVAATGQEAKLDSLRRIVAIEKRYAGLVHFRKMELVREARRSGTPKGAIAEALEITRPTLDKWIAGAQK